MSVDIIKIFYNTIHSDTFWTAMSSVATFLACFIALWQTKQSNLKKIKFKINTAIAATGFNDTTTFICATVTNLGNRKVIIKEWSFFLKNNKKYLILTNKTPFLPIDLPKIIQPEETLDLYFEYDNFKNCLIKAIDEKNLSKNQKLTFCLKDSTGTIYKDKLNIPVKNIIGDLEVNNAD